MLFQARKRTESHRRVKDALLRGSSIYDALCAAGYSPKQARKGRAAIPDAVFELMTREELLDNVWGVSSYLFTRTVDNHIAKLRQKIERAPADPEYLITIHRIGYKFAG